MNDLWIIMKNELVVTAIIFLLLFIRIGKGMKNDTLLPLIQFLLLANVVQAFFFNKEGLLFDGLFYSNSLIVLQKAILSTGVYIISLVCSSWLRKSEHMSEFFVLMLSALLGMDFMISSGNMLMFYLSLELATIPVAAMANFELKKKVSSEAAMKMILSSAFSSGILLFGISLLYGATGTLNFNEIPVMLDNSPLQMLAFIFLFTAFAFKLSVVPFHLWTADVYEGSPVAVTAFLSVVSKGAVAFILLTVLHKVFHPMMDTWYNLLMILSILTMITGNIFAVRQQNMKRFLAFSSIAQVGFILVGMTNSDRMGPASVVYFVLVYVFSNLAAFGVISAISTQTGKETVDDYKGLYRSNPFLSWVLALALFSLAGIPPTAGFFGKLFLLTAGGAKGSYWFIGIAALNMIISLYYYLRVIRSVFMDKNENPVEPITVGRPATLGLLLCSAGILAAGVFSYIFEYIRGLLD